MILHLVNGRLQEAEFRVYDLFNPIWKQDSLHIKLLFLICYQKRDKLINWRLIIVMISD